MIRPVTCWVAAVLLVAGCTGVPTSSSPQPIEAIKGGGQPPQLINPPSGASAREIVQDFLDAGTVNPVNHASAYRFLTKAAQSRWTGDPVTIISDRRIGTQSGDTVKVQGRKIGTLDKAGIFQPSSDNDNGQPVTYGFKVKRENGQYRVNPIRSGLLVTPQQFAGAYFQHLLYFFDDANQSLVADPRYSDIVGDQDQLATWLLKQLVVGPREQLQDALTVDTFPAQADAESVSVKTQDDVVRAEIPGSSALDSDGRAHLAAQVSQTLDQAAPGATMEITDGGRAVYIPSIRASQFVPATFAGQVAQPNTSPTLYYLNGGRVFTAAGKPIAGDLGRGTRNLSSVALSEPNGASLLVAGVAGPPGRAELFVGNPSHGLRSTGLIGALTRPTFAPRRQEVWIGDGNQLWRETVGDDGLPERRSTVPVIGMEKGDVLRAVRISPDGVRIAMVQATRGQPEGTLVIGSIVRSNGRVTVEAPEKISPQNESITDVAWQTSVRLIAIGHVGSSEDARTFDTHVDGSSWTSRPVNLFSEPTQVAATVDAVPWLSAGGFVWEQQSDSWVPPTGGQTPGTAPVYVE